MQTFFFKTLDGLHLGLDGDVLDGIINGLKHKRLRLGLWRVNEMRVGPIIIEQEEVKVRWLPCLEVTTSCADPVTFLIVMVTTVAAHTLFL
jgi:hypothetical protein